ncbi:hypothetical protein BgAZ_305010 [Babesia gibsoni]|uniref:CS domain-containing protein n=1 Tax=Babesia gibsoni TaxID=33632 RepID=A0AAD8PD58_BABGI|nr:hypothetical protein BgAZ_305010 [Babesia gibsoni]
MDSTLKATYNGTTKYYWQQNYEGITVYVDIPSGLKKGDIHVDFAPNRLSIRVGKDAEVKGELNYTVDTSECTWIIADGKLEVYLTKAIKGEVWNCVIKGDGTLNELDKEEDKKLMLLERFQKEHPGFDFSGADINGMVPEPRTFMKDN